MANWEITLPELIWQIQRFYDIKAEESPHLLINNERELTCLKIALNSSDLAVSQLVAAMSIIISHVAFRIFNVNNAKSAMMAQLIKYHAGANTLCVLATKVIATSGAVPPKRAREIL